MPGFSLGLPGWGGGLPVYLSGDDLRSRAATCSGRKRRRPSGAALRAGKRVINAALRCDPDGEQDASGCFFPDPPTVTEPSINHVTCAHVHGRISAFRADTFVFIFMLGVQSYVIFTSDCGSAFPSL